MLNQHNGLQHEIYQPDLGPKSINFVLEGSEYVLFANPAVIAPVAAGILDITPVAAYLDQLHNQISFELRYDLCIRL